MHQDAVEVLDRGEVEQSVDVPRRAFFFNRRHASLPTEEARANLEAQVRTYQGPMGW
jgi:hypothetical protein